MEEDRIARALARIGLAAHRIEAAAAAVRASADAARAQHDALHKEASIALAQIESLMREIDDEQPAQGEQPGAHLGGPPA